MMTARNHGTGAEAIADRFARWFGNAENRPEDGHG
jgi:hypothetical protein